MTTGITPARRARLAKIHLAAKQLALTDESYRDLLRRVTGLDSAKAMSDAQIDLVLGEFKRLGFTPKPRAEAPRSDKAYVRMIYGLWQDLKPYLRDHSKDALRKFVRRQTDADAPEFLSPEQGNDVIEGLKSWLAREHRNAGAAKGTGYVSAGMRRKNRRDGAKID